MRVDFHLHTTHSDGRSTPSELSQLVRAKDIELWSITDHDTTAAYDELPAAEQPPIAGVEVSSWNEHGGEVHITALGVDRHHEPFQAFLARIRAIRQSRMTELCAALSEAGATIDLATVAAEMPHGDAEASRIFTRSHLASALRRTGQTAAAESLFQDTFQDTFHISPAAQFPNSAEAITQIQQAGGIALLAHPGCYGSHQTVKKLLSAAPFDGLESNHPRILPSDRQFFKSLAQKHQFIESCGSDFHGRPDAMRSPGRCRLEKKRLEPLLKRLIRPTSHRPATAHPS